MPVQADAPPPLELPAAPRSSTCPARAAGISKWAASGGGEYSKDATPFGRAGQLFGVIDASGRTNFSSSVSYSKYVIVPGYALVNMRAGFRAASGWTVFVWSPKSSRHQLFRAADRRAWQHRFVRRTTW